MRADTALCLGAQSVPRCGQDTDKYELTHNLRAVSHRTCSMNLCISGYYWDSIDVLILAMCFYIEGTVLSYCCIPGSALCCDPC